MAAVSDNVGTGDLDVTIDNLDLSVEEMEQRFIARYSELNFIRDQYLGTKIPGYSRSQANVIGGFNDLEDVGAAIEPTGSFFAVFMRIPPGGRVEPHNHPTLEVLMPVEGSLTVMWGLDGDNRDGRRRIELGTLDTIAIPPGVFRTFHNQSDQDVVIHFTIGTDRPPTPIAVPEWVKREARDAGWEIDETGVLRQAADNPTT